MRTFTRFIVAWAGVASMMAAGDRSVAAEPAQSAAQLSSAHAERLFALKIAPLIKRKCLGCHGEDAKDLKGEFDVRSLSGLLKGGESGEASLVPGQPEESPLFSAIKWEGYEMPPKENDRLTAAEIELVRQWIAAGAPWPDDKRQAELRTAEWSIEQNEDGVLVKTSGGLSDEWTYRRYDPADLWSFRPVVAVAVPDGVHPIDWFLQQKLNSAGFEMTDEADPQTLIRRATYDLIGLPPTPGETESFVNAYRQNPERAWNQLIDRLLESPHYGERWGQHWLDGVRFVQIFSGGWDSHDYLERGHTARIRSVDKPIAALIKDLKARGLLDDTLVVWTGEFGRTPDNNKRGGVYSLGRGHNADALTMLFAGGGVKPGLVGGTDELGASAVDCVHPIRDVHVTLLHLLGLDDNKLTYFHAGRFKQLSQFGGEVIRELIA